MNDITNTENNNPTDPEDTMTADFPLPDNYTQPDQSEPVEPTEPATVQDFAVIKENPLLKPLRTAIPPEKHRLPSGGRFYENGELHESVKDGELNFYPMATIDELDMKSPDMLFSGEAFINVVSRCVPQVLNPLELFVKDADFILLALRKITYGPEYIHEMTHDCEKAKKHTYSIDLNQKLVNAKEIDPVKFTADSVVKIDRTGQIVYLQPLKLKHMVEMMQMANDATNEQQRERVIFSSLIKGIKSVSNITDPEQILEWLALLPSPDRAKIAKKLESISNFGPSYKHVIQCKDCKEDVDIVINTNTFTFFTSS